MQPRAWTSPGRRALPPQRNPRRRDQQPLLTTGTHVLSAAPGTPKVPVPPLTALDLEALSSDAAQTLRSSLLVAMRPYMFRSPSCVPADHPATTVAQFDLFVRSTPKQAVVTGTGNLRVIDGPAVDAQVLACLRGRMPETLIVPSPGPDLFPTFEGDAAIRAFLTGDSSCKPP